MTKPDADIPETLEEFWPYYLGEHSLVQTRNLHVFGTTIGLTLVITALFQGRLALAILGIVIAYGLAWYSHFQIEGNKPATFQRPVLSFLCDFRMLHYFLTGRLEDEVKRHQEAKELL